MSAHKDLEDDEVREFRAQGVGGSFVSMLMSLKVIPLLSRRNHC